MPPFEGSADLRPAVRHTNNEVIKEKIEGLGLDDITTVIENIEEASKRNPNLLKDSDEREKLEKAQMRLAKLLEENPETIH